MRTAHFKIHGLHMNFLRTSIMTLMVIVMGYSAVMAASSTPQLERLTAQLIEAINAGDHSKVLVTIDDMKNLNVDIGVEIIYFEAKSLAGIRKYKKALKKVSHYIKKSNKNGANYLNAIKLRNEMEVKTKHGNTASFMDNLLRGGETKSKPTHRASGGSGLNSMLRGLNEEMEVATLERKLEAEILHEKKKLEQQQAQVDLELRSEKRRLRREQINAEIAAEEQEEQRLEEQEEAKEEYRRSRRKRQAAIDDREDTQRRKEWAAHLGDTADGYIQQNRRIMRDTDKAFEKSKKIKQRQDRSAQEDYNRKQITNYPASISDNNNDYSDKLTRLQQTSNDKNKALEEKKHRLNAQYEKRRAALENKTATENKREEDLLNRQKQLAANKQIKQVASKNERASANILNDIKNGTRLAAKNCFGQYHVSGHRPKVKNSLSCIDVHFQYWCKGSPASKRTGILDKFVGQSAGCFGDTTEIEKPICKPKDIIVKVSRVTECGE